jgi:hypothetical protein
VGIADKNSCATSPEASNGPVQEKWCGFKGSCMDKGIPPGPYTDS